jgi:hypothetical protein
MQAELNSLLPRWLQLGQNPRLLPCHFRHPEALKDCCGGFRFPFSIVRANGLSEAALFRSADLNCLEEEPK